MEHPPDNPDLAPCTFFLFGALKQAFARQRFDTIDNRFIGVEAFLRGLYADFLQTIVQKWVWRLQLCHEGGGEYFE
jgi:hypothetical protein